MGGNGGGGRARGEGGGDIGVVFLKLLNHALHLLPVVVVADGGQSLPYCHSPLRGQITSEHCLAGQVQKPLTPPMNPPPSADGCIYVRTWQKHSELKCVYLSQRGLAVRPHK